MFKTLAKDMTGFGLVEIILVLFISIAIFGVGFYAVKTNNKSPIGTTVHAGSYEILSTFDGVTVSACKSYFSGYGGGYNVHLLFTKLSNAPSYYYNFNTYSPYRQYKWGYPTTSNKYYANTVAAYTASASLVFGDQVQVNIYDAYNLSQLGNAKQITLDLGVGNYNYAAGLFPWANINNC